MPHVGNLIAVVGVEFLLRMTVHTANLNEKKSLVGQLLGSLPLPFRKIIGGHICPVTPKFKPLGHDSSASVSLRY